MNFNEVVELLIEKEAKVISGKLSVVNKIYESIDKSYNKVFASGVEWQKKQSPWISVKEQLPETNDGQSLYEVVVVTSDRRFLVVVNIEVEHLVRLLGVTHWMNIPQFNE